MQKGLVGDWYGYAKGWDMQKGIGIGLGAINKSFSRLHL